MSKPPVGFSSAVIMILLMFVLAGCGAPQTAPTLTPTNLPPPPMATNQPPPPPPAPSPTLATPTAIPQPAPSLFQFFRTIQVTPDELYLSGGFTRIYYVPALDRFAVTFGGKLAQPSAVCQDKGYSYKMYTADLQETGETGTFACDPVDAGSVMVENTYYHVGMTRQGEAIGWHLMKLDAASGWKPLEDKFLPLETPLEADTDPMVAYVNGLLDLSGQFNASGSPPPIEQGAATFHYFFSRDLELVDKKILSDTPHINGSSMIFLNGVYHLVTSNAYSGDMVVIQYDQDWRYLGVKTLMPQAHWSMGLANDGKRFYVAYLDTSQRLGPGFIPVFLNVHLAAFDMQWNLLEDVAVTSYSIEDNMQTGRPWVLLHDSRLYVGYDLDTRDPVTYSETMNGQAIISIYELIQP